MSLYNLLASFFELAGTGNSILTHHIIISVEQNNCFSGTQTDVSVGFASFLVEKLGLTFSEICKLLR